MHGIVKKIAIRSAKTALYRHYNIASCRKEKTQRFEKDIAKHPQRRRYTLVEMMDGVTPEVMAELNADLAWSLDIEPVGRELL